MIDICECCHEPIEPDRDGCDPGLCWDCTEALRFDDDGYEDDEPNPDNFVQITDPDDVPEEPMDDDLVTHDYKKFFRFDFHGRPAVVVVKEGDDWQREVKRYMLKQHFYPNVWYQEERGGYTLVSLNADGEEYPLR